VGAVSNEFAYDGPDTGKTYGTTARRTRGRSRACGIWSRAHGSRYGCSPGEDGRRSSRRRTAARAGGAVRLRTHASAAQWQPVWGRHAACTRIIVDTTNASRSSSAFCPPARSGRRRAARSGPRSTAALVSEGIPDPQASGRAQRARIAMHLSSPKSLMKKHWDVMRATIAGAIVEAR